MRDIRTVLSRLQRVQTSGFPGLGSLQMQTLGAVDGLPMVHMASAPTIQPRCLLVAGTHGDEPASVEAALQWLEDRSATGRLPAGMGIDVLPCTNPVGWCRNTRENGDGIDVNWAFDRDDVAEVQILRAFLQGRRWQVIVDFHEDWEASGFYLYEHRRGGEYIGDEVTARVEAVCPLDPAAEIDGWPAQGAVIHADDSVERLQRGDGFPLVLLRDHTDHKLTTETPTSLPLSQRVEAHHAALAAILRCHFG